MLLRSALILLLSVAPALANPWPRDTSGTFIAITEDFSDTDDTGETSLFIESGGGRSGVSIGVSSVLDEVSDEWSAFAFVRQPLTASGARARVSLSAGFGAQHTDAGETEPLVIAGSITDQARIQLGATVDLSGDAATGFRLGTWLEF